MENDMSSMNARQLVDRIMAIAKGKPLENFAVYCDVYENCIMYDLETREEFSLESDLGDV